MDQYQGFYARFDTPSKQVGQLMMGADDIVGNEYSISLEVEDGRTVVWIANKFGEKRGFLDERDSARIQLALAREWRVHALLSFVAYSEQPEPGLYWGEVAVLCWSPVLDEAMEGFLSYVAGRLAEGVRPRLDLGHEALEHLIKDPSWMPTETLPMPKMEKGSAMIKDHQSLNDKIVEQGRAGNRGCYAISWVLIIAIAALVIYFVLSFIGVV